jgi:hypothetical protein
LGVRIPLSALHNLQEVQKPDSGPGKPTCIPLTFVEPLFTLFAPAERTGQEELTHQMEIFLTNRLLVDTLNAIPDIIVALNQQRQIVFANRRIQGAVLSGGIKSAIGLRPGEALGCIHSDGSNLSH